MLPLVVDPAGSSARRMVSTAAGGFEPTVGAYPAMLAPGLVVDPDRASRPVGRLIGITGQPMRD
jgi:hypothetical protein